MDKILIVKLKCVNIKRKDIQSAVLVCDTAQFLRWTLSLLRRVIKFDSVLIAETLKQTSTYKRLKLNVFLRGSFVCYNFQQAFGKSTSILLR